MLWKKTGKFWKSGFAVISCMLIFSSSGCSDTPKEETAVAEPAGIEQNENDSVQQDEMQNTKKDAGEMTDVCLELYKQAAEENKLTDLEMIRRIVNRFGENGYPAVDSRNQIDMAQANQVVCFCEMVEEKKEAEITIIKVGYGGGFVTYDLHTKDGNVDVARSSYQYQNGRMQKKVTSNYPAKYWKYTKDGYLMFSGVWFSEELYVLTMSPAEEYAALRVQPLEESCRKLNRDYLLPVSYERNNMFLVDWSEEEFKTLNFYDMFDIFYPCLYEEKVPYIADDNLGVDALYHIPKEEFERVIMAYFKIDSETLQSKTNYCEKEAVYEYRPRGFYEVESLEYPYPEVVRFTENSDGTIALTVHVVFPYTGNSMVYAHEVVVRPLENGGVQYVSNRVIESEENQAETWHTPRLTEEERKEFYFSGQ